jgi:hypothetical protein
MKAHVLCVDNNGSRSMEHRKGSEDAAFVVPDACHETRAADLLVEESHGVQSPFFLQWLDDWKRRASESTNDEPLHTCRSGQRRLATSRRASAT